MPSRPAHHLPQALGAERSAPGWSTSSSADRRDLSRNVVTRLLTDRAEHGG
jgi:hypothetical protein